MKESFTLRPNFLSIQLFETAFELVDVSKCLIHTLEFSGSREPNEARAKPLYSQLLAYDEREMDDSYVVSEGDSASKIHILKTLIPMTMKLINTLYLPLIWITLSVVLSLRFHQ